LRGCFAAVVCFCVSFAVHSLAGPEKFVEAAAWMRNGSGDFSAEDPPHSWDAATGANVLWKARLPNWSNGGPIVVQSGQSAHAYVMSEPVNGFPVLQCIDADSGKLLWEREVDWSVLLPDDEAAVVRKQLSDLYKWSAGLLREHAVFKEIAAKNRGKKMERPRTKKELPGLDEDDGMELEEAPPKPTPDQASWDAAAKRAKALGWTGKFGGRAGGSVNLQLDRNHPMVKLHYAFIEKYAPVFPAWGPGLGTYRWSQGFYGESWEGMTFPTPVSDGHYVWVLTGHAAVACYDRAGNLIWIRRFNSRPGMGDLGPKMQKLAKRRKGKDSWPGPIPGGGDASTSPRLMDGKLVLQAFKFIRALDPATGKLLWEVPDAYTHGHSFGTPEYIEISGVPAVVTGERGEILRLLDGAILGGPFGEQHLVRVWQNKLLCRDKNGVKLLRLKLADEDQDQDVEPGDGIVAEPKLTGGSGKLSVEELWKVGKPVDLGGRPAIGADRLYGKGWVCHLATGKVVAGEKGQLPNAGGGYVWPMRLLVKGCELSVDATKGHFVFRDTETHKAVGEVQMEKDPLGAANSDHVASRVGLKQWFIFGAGLPYAYKDRLYIRSHDYLYCIGHK